MACETVSCVKKCLLKMGFIESDLNVIHKCDLSSHGCSLHKGQIFNSIISTAPNSSSLNEINVGCKNEKEVSLEPCGLKVCLSPTVKTKRNNKRSPSPFSLRNNGRKSLNRKEKNKKSPNPKTVSSNLRRRSLSSLDTKKTSIKKTFGGNLDDLPLFSAQLSDGTMVYVPEFIIDVSKVIAQNISIEGIFRKAGSSQRQAELKRLLNIGKDLPSTVHPIDAACLLKHFLNSLALPLIPTSIFSLMVRCLELTEESQFDAIILCSLLIERKRQDTLCYILELLAKVASNQQKNFMGSHNLSIVMAPNVFPQSLYKGKNLQRISSVDLKVSSAILVMKILIEGAHKVCRAPESIKLILNASKGGVHESTQQEGHPLANLTKTTKKRRSGPINKIVNGLRRVVQGDLYSSSSNSSPANGVKETSKSTSTPVSSQINATENRASRTNLCNKENKKKPLSSCDSSDEHPNKRLRIEKVQLDEPLPIAIRVPLVPQQKKSSSLFSLKESRRNPFKASSQNVYTSPHLKISCPDIEMKFPINNPISVGSPSDSFKISSMPPSPNLNVVEKPQRRRSCEATLQHDNAQRQQDKPILQTPKRRSETFRKFSSPDGSVDSILGPRGVPDGAECTIRDPLPVNPSGTNQNLQEMEEHYCEVKLAVKHLEEEVDRKNLNKINDYFPVGDSAQLSFSEMISKAYESVKTETLNIDDLTPTESMSRRLDKELKIRGRRSSEYKVSRSPSERKIGIVRRRSKELKEKFNQQSVHSSDFPMTPKLKSPLLHTPSQPRLKCVTPHSIKFAPGPLKPYNHDLSKLNSTTTHHYTAPVTRQRSAIVKREPPPIFKISPQEWKQVATPFNDPQMATPNNPGVAQRSILKGQSPVRNVSNPVHGSTPNGIHWTPAQKFMTNLEHQPRMRNMFLPDLNSTGHRSSIAALRRQKKVSANVQLFSKMKPS